MAKDDFFEKKRRKQSSRKAGKLEPKPNTFLIVSEGSKTEPLYFDGLRDYVNTHYGDSIQSEKPLIHTEGRGRCTVKLVEETDHYVARCKKPYSQVWVVFDMDDNKDFDEAIRLATKKGYRVAWSNRSFEYWIFLHFRSAEAALDQAGWTRKIDEIFRQKQISPNGYEKNNTKVFEIATTEGSLKDAMKRAEEREAAFTKGTPPSRCDPCTKVHHLIRELAPYLSELLK